MTDIDSEVQFEEAEDGGLELVFPEDLLETIGVGAGDEVTVQTRVVDGSDVQLEVDFGVDLDDETVSELEEVLDDSLTILTDE